MTTYNNIGSNGPALRDADAAQRRSNAPPPGQQQVPPRRPGEAFARGPGHPDPRHRDASSVVRGRPIPYGPSHDGPSEIGHTAEAASPPLRGPAGDTTHPAPATSRGVVQPRPGSRREAVSPWQFIPASTAPPSAPADTVETAAPPPVDIDGELAKMDAMHRDHKLSLLQQMKDAAEAGDRSWLQMLCAIHMQADEHFIQLKQDFLANANKKPDIPQRDDWPKGPYYREECHELSQILDDIKARRARVRRELGDAIRTACELRDIATLTMLAEWHLQSEDNFYAQLSGPLTARLKEDEKLRMGLEAERLRVRTKLRQSLGRRGMQPPHHPPSLLRTRSDIDFFVMHHAGDCAHLPFQPDSKEQGVGFPSSRLPTSRRLRLSLPGFASPPPSWSAPRQATHNRWRSPLRGSSSSTG